MSNSYGSHMTPQQLDEIDKTKPTLKHILVHEIELIIGSLGNFFQRGMTKDAHKAVAEKLVNSGYRYTAVKSGIERIIETSDKYPSYAEIVTSCRLYMPVGSLDKSDKLFEAEEEKFNKIKEQFFKAVGEGGDVKIVQWWLKNVSDIPFKDHESMIYLKPALFDWFDSGMGKDFEKMKQIGLRKKEEIQQKINSQRLSM